jgi:hypothetical protein
MKDLTPDGAQDGTFAMIASEGHLFGWITDSRRLTAQD